MILLESIQHYRFSHTNFSIPKIGDKLYELIPIFAPLCAFFILSQQIQGFWVILNMRMNTLSPM